MKKILGIVIAGIGLLLFISLYFIMVFYKENQNIGYYIMGLGYVSIIIFVGGITLYVKNKKLKNK